MTSVKKTVWTVSYKILDILGTVVDNGLTVLQQAKMSLYRLEDRLMELDEELWDDPLD